MTAFDPDGTAYLLEGAVGRPLVVLSHGVGMDLHMWSGQVEALSERFQVLRYDMLGHGRTPGQPDANSIDSFSKQLFRLLEHLQADPVALVGFSMGGLVAQHFALCHPRRLHRLVLMNTVYQRDAEELQGVRSRLELARKQGLETIADAAIDRWFTPAYTDKHPHIVRAIHERIRTNNLAGYLKAYEIFVHADDAIGDGLRNVQCPSLVMTGELDSGSTPLMAERMAASMARAHHIILKGLGHMAPVESPNQVNQALLSFLL